VKYVIYFSPRASVDIDNAIKYYDSQSNGLGKLLAIEIDVVLNKISELPNLCSVRYNNIRAAKLAVFPYLLFYKIDDRNNKVYVLRCFNTHQQPFWKH
jgi:hypothetical protein